jgi:signal transduction histidine kinase
VSVFDGDSFTNYTTADGLTSNDVHSIAVDGKTVWIGTDGGGVSRFDGDVFQSLTARDGLPDNVALSVRPDGNGGVWIGTAQGLVHHRPRPSPDVPVVIDAVVADRRYAGVDSVAVPSTVDLIAIEFHSISLKTRVGQTVFCYRLAGEQGWRHTRDNRVEYHSLPRGDYTFEVLAVDRDLNYSAVPARISLSVHLPYERIAWLSLLGVTVVLLAWQATRIVRRDHRLQLSNRELEEKTRALEKAHQEVMQASQAKSAFLANVSHELRTPLNAIINFSALILENTYGDISDDLRDAVEEIDHNGDNLLNLINDVLDLSKIEAGAMKLQFAECAPSVCVETAVTAMLHRARNKGLALSGEVEDDLPELWADQRRLTQQVLVNLVDNAIKFTNQGDVRVGAARDNGDVHFWVADTGQGIASADRDRVFQPFYQVDGTATRAAGGTGLGLAIVRRFVELHGGSIWLESEEGRGSTFHFRIPHSPSTGG